MSEMIERAVAEVRKGAIGVIMPGSPHSFVNVEAAVRAVMEVMRDPSQAMLDAVCTDDPNGAPFHDDTIREVFREMIDAALKPAAP